MSENHLLLTGFGPFGGSAVNPSEKAVRALDGEEIGAWQITSRILPVARHEGPAALLAALVDLNPGAVVCLGEATRRAAISIERVAINLLDFRIPDNCGETINDEPVIAGAPAAYFATLPVRSVLQAMLSAGVPAELSLTAGAFLCNQVFYHLLHHLATTGETLPAGFIHLPALPEQAANNPTLAASMSLDTILHGLRAGIAVIPPGASHG